jgi:hypothetical protein
MDTGISLQKVRKALDYVHNELKRPLQEVFLVSDGTTIYARTTADQIIDILSGGQAVFAIAVGKVYEELQGTIAEFKKPEEEEPAAGSVVTEAHGS